MFWVCLWEICETLTMFEKDVGGQWACTHEEQEEEEQQQWASSTSREDPLIYGTGGMSRSSLLLTCEWSWIATWEAAAAARSDVVAWLLLWRSMSSDNWAAKGIRTSISVILSSALQTDLSPSSRKFVTQKTAKSTRRVDHPPTHSVLLPLIDSLSLSLSHEEYRLPSINGHRVTIRICFWCDPPLFRLLQ